MSELSRMQMSPMELIRISEQLQQQAHGQVDMGFVKTLLFPELYNADIPQPMSTQSYTRFSDKKEISFSCGANGSGMILFYPKTNIGPQVFFRTDAAINSPLAFGFGDAKWLQGGWQDYSPYFSQTSLVSASISLQYVGQLQNEQGYFVASQIYGISPSNITTNDIENGQFRVMAKPGDGAREVYLPKDLSDFSYYSCGYTGKSGTIRTRNGGKNPNNDVIQNTIANLANQFIDGVPAQVANDVYGVGAKLEWQSDADCIAIYWTGMKTGQGNDLRLDIIRKFNGFPLASQRDVLDLIKPRKIFDPKKTIDVISELQMAVPQIAGHSLKQMSRVSDQIQEFIPNLGYLYNEGLLKEGTTLDSFSGQLQMMSGMEGQAPAVGRIYD